MRAFDHVLILYSFVFALALTHLLSRVGSLMLARKRVRFSALHAFMVVNAVVLVFVNWLALWFVHDVQEWDLFSITIYFLFALSTFFFCAAAAPEASFEGTVDLEAFYWENYRLFYGLGGWSRSTVRSSERVPRSSHPITSNPATGYVLLFLVDEHSAKKHCIWAWFRAPREHPVLL
jgi:hypothetical protein